MSAGTYSRTLLQRGVQPFLWTQFFGAFNDNVCKIAASMLAVNLAAAGGGGSGYLSLVGVIFMLPFLLFSGYAGYVADAFNKRSVLIVTKAFEIAAMGLAIPALLSGRIEPVFVVLFLMALQSTFFSPAKYGIVPEMLTDRDLSRANGLLEMSTFLAIILGTSVGSLMFVAWKDQLALLGGVMVLIAVAGTLLSFGIPHVSGSATLKRFRWNPWAEIGRGLARLAGDRTLALTVAGISYFWFLGALLQMDILLFGKEIMRLDDFWIGILGSFLAVGIGVGSLAAGRLSGDKVELGLVPLGSIGMGIFSLLLASAERLPMSPYAATSLSLAALGFSGGLFIVPLNALLQQRSRPEEKGLLISTNNFLNTGGILLASGALWLLRDLVEFPADRIALVCGLVTLVATGCLLVILPDFLVRFTLWMLTHSLYRIRIVGQEHVPFRGPALLVCNHVSHVDGFLVGACIQRFVRFMVYRPYYDIKAFNGLLRLMKAIPVSGGNRKEVVESLEKARRELAEGHVVCIFAEGAISRTGNLLPFKRGFERIVDGTGVPVIPVYLDRLWGSIFSFKDGRFFWKWPRRLPYPVTVSFGAPLPPTARAEDARRAILELGSEAVKYRRRSSDLLPLRFIRTAKRRWFSFCMADSSGRELTCGNVLVASVLLAGWIRRLGERQSDPRELGAQPEMVGIVLPASTGAAIANLAVLLAGKIPVNLNFTAGQDAVDSAVQQCDIRIVLTSRAFVARAKLPAIEGTIFLEDVVKEITPLQKVRAAVAAFLLPSRLVLRLHDGSPRNPDSLATVIFSSGSTGTPKGVMLSHHNILSNLEAMAQIFWVTSDDRMLGVLPLFHSFGFTGTLWFPLISGFGVAYHPNPIDAKAIGELAGRYRASLLISTPTFYASYTRHCTTDQFSYLRYAVVGAEKLREPVATAFKEKFGRDLLEGYGCTEMAPVVSVNVPDFEKPGFHQTGVKPETVGHPIPGVAVKVVDPATEVALPSGVEGLLLVKGPNRMMGYLARPDLTAEVLRDGWYVTGDIGSVDEDGFIRITDRLSRFSKIAGEMVTHLRIEEAINDILGEAGCAVTAVPDEAKGERLVVFYTKRDVPAEVLWERLSESDLPRLWLPKRDNIFLIDAIPLLGTGKTDLKRVKAMALERHVEAV